MAIRRKYIWIGILLVPLGVVALLAAYVFVGTLAFSGQGDRVTTGREQDWTEEYMLREFRSVQREGSKVRLEAVNGRAVLLGPGQSFENNHYHGGQTYTVRQVLPGKVVIHYEAFHSMGGNSSRDSGTVELAYRTSTPLTTRDAQRAAITQRLQKQITSLKPSADGTAVEVATAAPMTFHVRGERPEVTREQVAQRITLHPKEYIGWLESADVWTMIEVKEVRPTGLLLEYRSASEWKASALARAMRSTDEGQIELPFRQ